MAPGLTFRELAEKGWRTPNEFVAQRYSALAHGVGMCDEWPAVSFIEDWDGEGAYDGTFEPGMTVCIESYIGAEGGAEGVKLEEQVLVTDSGVERLSTFPFEDELFG